MPKFLIISVIAAIALASLYAGVTSVETDASLQSAEGKVKAKQPLSYVVIEDPSGHTSIAIDDDQLKTLKSGIIPFSEFKAWDYDAQNPSDAPASVVRFHDTQISVAGFMFPLNEGEKIKAFMLMASTQTCCYGPRPEFNQFILVEVDEPVTFERLNPVSVTGQFYVEPRPDDGYIYRMHGDSVELVDMVAVEGLFQSAPQSLPTVNWTSSAPLWLKGPNPGVGDR